MNHKKSANKQDKRVAEKTGFRVRPNSGAISGHKGDLGGPDIFLETKTRESNSPYLQIDQSWLDKLRDQAFSMGKPLYVLVISSGDDFDYVVLDKALFSKNEFGDALIWSEIDVVFSNLSKVIKVPVKELDKALYKKRRDHLAPCYNIFASREDRYISIMTLDDFLEAYNRRSL